MGAARAKDLDAPVVSMLLEAVVANGTVPAFELIFLRPGNRAVSEGCYWGCTFDQARDRSPSYPSNAEMPFQSCVSASRAAFIDGKRPISCRHPGIAAEPLGRRSHAVSTLCVNTFSKHC